MMVRAWIVIALALACTSGAAARSPELSLRNSRPVTVGAGIVKVGEHDYAYRPASAAGPRPLIVLLHGAGMQARPFVEAMRGEADRCGCILLAVQSSGATWDMIRAVSKAGSRPLRADRMFGEDATRIEQAISALVAGGSVDRRRIVLAGFSDGASYALSLGRANPRLFRGIVAMAPGFQVEPGKSDPDQRIVIAHSEQDRILPFQRSRDTIFPSLKRAGHRAEFITYQGGHRIDIRVLGRAIGLVLQGAA